MLCYGKHIKLFFLFTKLNILSLNLEITLAI